MNLQTLSKKYSNIVKNTHLWLGESAKTMKFDN